MTTQEAMQDLCSKRTRLLAARDALLGLADAVTPAEGKTDAQVTPDQLRRIEDAYDYVKPHTTHDVDLPVIRLRFPGARAMRYSAQRIIPAINQLRRRIAAIDAVITRGGDIDAIRSARAEAKAAEQRIIAAAQRDHPDDPSIGSATYNAITDALALCATT